MQKIIAIVGPTACGKTRRAVEISRAFNGEIVSADSRQLYRNMDIGTGKDLAEYEEIRYHLIDIAEAGDKYNLHLYLKKFRQAILDIDLRGKRPIVCGGTGMYIENALNGIVLPDVDENKELRDSLKDKSLEQLTQILSRYKTLHNTTDIDTVKRAIRAIEISEYYKNHPNEVVEANKKTAKPLDAIVIGLDITRELRRERISARLDSRLEEGLVDEVKMLINRGINPQDLIYYGLEYKFVTLFVIGAISYKEMRENLETAIHQFAKRQMTWFRGMEKRGIKINWLPYDLPSNEFINEISSLLN